MKLVEPWDVASWNGRCLLLLLDAGEKVRDVLDVDVDPMDVIARVTLIGAFRRDPSASPSQNAVPRTDRRRREAT